MQNRGAVGCTVGGDLNCITVGLIIIDSQAAEGSLDIGITRSPSEHLGYMPNALYVTQTTTVNMSCGIALGLEYNAPRYKCT